MPSQLCVLLGPEKKKKEFILCETEELFTRPKAEHVPSLSKASYGPLHCKREVGVTDQNIMWPIKMQFILVTLYLNVFETKRISEYICDIVDIIYSGYPKKCEHMVQLDPYYRRHSLMAIGTFLQ